MTDEPQTSRARRLEAVEQGERASAIEAIDRPGRPRPGTPRYRQIQIRDRRAADLDIPADQLGTRDTIDGGVRISAKDESRGDVMDAIRRQFAADREFTEPADVTAGISGQSIEATPFVTPNRRSQVAERARPTAAEQLDTEPETVRVGVGPFGIENVQFNPQADFDNPFGDPEDIDMGLGGGDIFDSTDVFGTDDSRDSLPF